MQGSGQRLPEASDLKEEKWRQKPNQHETRHGEGEKETELTVLYADVKNLKC